MDAAFATTAIAQGAAYVAQLDGAAGGYILVFTDISSLDICLKVTTEVDGLDSSVIIPGQTALDTDYPCENDYFSPACDIQPDVVFVTFPFGEGSFRLFSRNRYIGRCGLKFNRREIASFLDGATFLPANFLRFRLSASISRDGSLIVLVSVFKGERRLATITGTFQASGSLQGTAYANVQARSKARRDKITYDNLLLQFELAAQRVNMPDSVQLLLDQAKAAESPVLLRAVLESLGDVRSKEDESEEEGYSEED